MHSKMKIKEMPWFQSLPDDDEAWTADCEAVAEAVIEALLADWLATTTDCDIEAEIDGVTESELEAGVTEAEELADGWMVVDEGTIVVDDVVGATSKSRINALAALIMAYWFILLTWFLVLIS